LFFRENFLKVIGIHGYTSSKPKSGAAHNSGVAWIENGIVVAAIEEERLSRKKNDYSFPFLSLKQLLAMQENKPQFTALAQRSNIKYLPDLLRNYAQARKLTKNSTFKKYLTGKLFELPLRTCIQACSSRKVPESVAQLPRGETNHHQAHAASAYYCCPWPDQDVLVITLDGHGESHCGSGWIGRQGKMEVLFWLSALHSVGNLYSAVTAHLGFKPMRHEGKIVGLAAYGNPEPFYSRLNEHVTGKGRYLAFDADLILLAMLGNRKGTEELFNSLTAGLSREDISAGLQKFTEETVCNFVQDWVKQTGIQKLALAGGVFANVKLNQRIMELTDVDNIYIHPNMGDGGLAVGAALNEFANSQGGLTPQFMTSAYLGPDIEVDSAKLALETAGVRYTRPEALAEEAAALLANGLVIARAAGRMEYGPRALGNRTLFASCSDPTINKWLNDRLQRTEFMPFAPIIMEEFAAEYFPAWRPEHYAARFMTITYDASETAKKNIPAAIHIDGTARPQVLRQQDNPEVYAILKAFHARTGVPALINTSFNMHEEPIVCSASDAVRAFQLGNIDALICADLLAVTEQ
jgi:carbamoyltransferase